MSRWGVYCRVCNRLLWTMERKLKQGETLPSSIARHAVTNERPKLGDTVKWCGCKGGLAQQELFEAGNGTVEQQP